MELKHLQVGKMSFSWESVSDNEYMDLKELEKQIADFVDKSNVEETLRVQLSEFEMLQSMFSNPGELCVDDPSVLAEFNGFLDGTTPRIPPQLSFIINLVVDSTKFEVCVNLPLEYPNLEPDIFVRSEKFNRNQQRKLNLDLGNYVDNMERGELCICSVVAWLQDNAVNYYGKSNDTDISKKRINSSAILEDKVFKRFWVYSHHIYSKIKRRELLELANEHNVTGFCLPGRPGIICIEGQAMDCEEWWQKVRNMNWKKIILRKIEEEKIESNIESLKKFQNFQEISFEGGKVKGRECHMDFGELYKYLVDHNCGYIFRDYFGIDGKSQTTQ